MYEYEAIVTRVVDGDTYDVLVSLGFGISYAIRVRLRNCDTPETWRPKSEAEATHGFEASEFVKGAIQFDDVRIVTHKVGASIYGRYTADVFYTDDNGDEQNLAEVLKEMDLVKRAVY